MHPYFGRKHGWTNDQHQTSLLHFNAQYLLHVNILQTRSHGRAGFIWSALNALLLNSHPVVSEYCFIRRAIDRRADGWGNTAPGRETDREIHGEPRNIVHQEQSASKQAYCALLKASWTPAQSAGDTTNARRGQKHTRCGRMHERIHPYQHAHL